ncbi:DUF6454 family protein [Halobacillus yeomjeoni]|uniref:Uncharacterized protein n=1 Tax=Halobacillus yeomjeoni TaxID=311194 RepID=A0A931HXL7_9BACI|nr:DUF6454 family protein [Halobacillus yeomjeoni]MBH0231727.1 hypothetical protein [Halobacillus yeomjeoni]
MKKFVSFWTFVFALIMVSTVFAEDMIKEQSLRHSFKELTRSTEWKKESEVDLNFDVFHPQGMTKIGDKYFMSSVEIEERPKKYAQKKNGYDRSAGKGTGHLFVFNGKGELLKDIELGEGDIYHPGGIDFDGENIWVPVAEYRPDSKSIVYKIDAETFNVSKEFRVDDHIGGIVHNDQTGKLLGVSWGSRQYYEWNIKGKELKTLMNSSHFIDYQDCEYLEKSKMICSGIAGLNRPSTEKSYELGGLALVDTKTLAAEHEVPLAEFSSQQHVITRNPVFLNMRNKEIRLFAVPDDDKEASLLIYEAKTR